jgi:GNAT superfamily N-acetyltransferase
VTGTLTSLEWRNRAHLVAAHRLQQAIERESLPDEDTPVDEVAEELAASPEWRIHRWWGIWADAGHDLLAGAWLELEYGEANRTRAHAQLCVHPDARGRGLARAVARPLAEAALAEGRTELYGYCVEGSAGDGFCAHVGATKGMAERHSRLALDELDRSLLGRWIEAAPQPSYELLRWDGPTPRGLLDAFVVLRAAENTAPRGDLGEEDEVFTLERVEQSEAAKERAGSDWWTMAVRHRASGALAGYTRLVFSGQRPDVAFQAWTAVHPDHRGRGLARWLKAAMVERVVEERSAVRRIDTDNATTNRAMLAINVAMGFRPLRTIGVWELATEQLAKIAEG